MQKESYPEVTDKSIKLGDLPSKKSVDLVFPIVESFTALLYNGTTNAIIVDEARREMFVKDEKDLETIPQLLRHSWNIDFMLLIYLVMCRIMH